MIRLPEDKIDTANDIFSLANWFLFESGFTSTETLDKTLFFSDLVVTLEFTSHIIQPEGFQRASFGIS